MISWGDYTFFPLKCQLFHKETGTEPGNFLSVLCLFVIVCFQFAAKVPNTSPTVMVYSAPLTIPGVLSTTRPKGRSGA